VYRTPVVFFCQNNGWAISMPRERQTASETIAQKADAYGFDGVVVDGNDILAVDQVVSEAVDRARRGEGPTLVEAMTYRIHGHTTADDHGRYRKAADADRWQENDPLERVRAFLESRGEWDGDWQTQVEQAASTDIETAVTEAEEYAPFDAGEIFDAAFAEPTETLVEQRRESERGAQ
jgi:pyruvate dehydrogenase E1 component alpha subunit